MENLEPYKIDKLDISLEHKGDLLYHEGVILSHFVENYGEHYFYKWCDCDANYNRWKIFKISVKDLFLFFEKEITLLQLIQKNSFVYFMDLDNNLEQKSIFICPTQKIPKDYLPSENSFFDEIEYEMYASTLKDNLQKQANNAINFIQSMMEKTRNMEDIKNDNFEGIKNKMDNLFKSYSHNKEFANLLLRK